MLSENRKTARLGEFHLEESVISVLYEVYSEKICLDPAEISKRAGIFRERGEVDIMNDAIVCGILVKLHGEGRVERDKQENGKGGWKLSDKEFNKLNG